MRKHVGAGAAAALIGLGALAAVAGPATASSVEHQDGAVHSMDVQRATKNNARPRTNPQLTYHGGVGGVGVETTPHVYLIYWGADWQGQSSSNPSLPANDPAGLAPYQQKFFAALGTGETWSASTTQYCQGVSSGAATCGSGSAMVTQPASVFTPSSDVWIDTSPAPSRPTQSDLANEAIAAANHFGHTAAGSNASVQYVVQTFSGKNTSGFGTQFCAWHSSTTSPYGNIAYTNSPYYPDAGASCGAGIGGTQLAGVSIVGGHEYAETVTDQFPNGGWLDGGGSENGDKCAWISASSPGGTRAISLGTAGLVPMQSLWSNSFNNGAGGCVMSYTSGGATQTQ